MTLSIEQIKQILDGAPEGATHYQSTTYLRYDSKRWVWWSEAENHWRFVSDESLGWAQLLVGHHGSLTDLEEILALRQEVEILRMQLAACGVVAMANTTESANKARDMHPEYMSASCQDVMEAADREMVLRDQMSQQAELIEQQQLRIDELERKVLELSTKKAELLRGNDELATPQQNLNAIKREVISDLNDYLERINCGENFNVIEEYANQRYPDKE